MDVLAQYTADVFRLFGQITLGRMFAGHGMFYNGIMFGLVYNQTLYLKVDASPSILFSAVIEPNFASKDLW